MDTCQHSHRHVEIRAALAYAGLLGMLLSSLCFADGARIKQLSQLSAATASNMNCTVATSALDQKWSGNRDNDPGKLGWCSDPVNASNNSSLSGHVLANASSNVGLNQTAGTGNMQSDSLAMGVSNP